MSTVTHDIVQKLSDLMVEGGKSERIDMLSRLQRISAERGPVVAQTAGPFKMIQLFGPDANRMVLLDRDRIFSARQPWMMIMGRIFPNGLLLRDGDEHKEHRKIMHEAFTRPALRQSMLSHRMFERVGELAAAGDLKLAVDAA
jgi:cytochrome P450